MYTKYYVYCPKCKSLNNDPRLFKAFTDDLEIDLFEFVGLNKEKVRFHIFRKNRDKIYVFPVTKYRLIKATYCQFDFEDYYQVLKRNKDGNFVSITEDFLHFLNNKELVLKCKNCNAEYKGKFINDVLISNNASYIGSLIDESEAKAILLLEKV